MLLALDTSSRTIGIAIYNDTQVVSEVIWFSRNHHTIELAPITADFLARAAISSSSLKALAVAIGPGTFTGLRIGLAFAKGLALSQRIPIIGIPTLDILVQALPVDERPLIAILQAGRKRMAAGWYEALDERWQSTGLMKNLSLEELVNEIKEPTLVSGELSGEARHLLGRNHENIELSSPAHSLRRPAIMAEMAWKLWQTGEVDDPASLSPIYLHHGEPIPG